MPEPKKRPSRRHTTAQREADRRLQQKLAGYDGRRASTLRARRSRRRFVLILAAGVLVILLATTLQGVFSNSDSFTVPSRASLAGLSVSQRIVAIANSQVGYSADPSRSYCNKFSSYWDAGTRGCPRGQRSEKWCADFAAWAWRRAGVQFTYGYGAAQINGGAASFYEWAVAHGSWHPATGGYVAAAGDVAIYGLTLVPYPSAVHVALVTDDPPGQRGPDVINGDGDRTGFSVVESGTDQVRADSGRSDSSILAGYVSPPAT